MPWNLRMSLPTTCTVGGQNVDIRDEEEEEKEEEEELEIITIDDIDYCTNDLENGFIWELNEDGEQCDKIGYLKEGEPFFYADEN